MFHVLRIPESNIAPNGFHSGIGGAAPGLQSTKRYLVQEPSQSTSRDGFSIFPFYASNTSDNRGTSMAAIPGIYSSGSYLRLHRFRGTPLILGLHRPSCACTPNLVLRSLSMYRCGRVLVKRLCLHLIPWLFSSENILLEQSNSIRSLRDTCFSEWIGLTTNPGLVTLYDFNTRSKH